MTYELISPLSTHLVNTLRDSQTDALRFRQNIKTLSIMLADKALQKDALKKTPLFTWQGKYNFEQFDESNGAEKLCFQGGTRRGFEGNIGRRESGRKSAKRGYAAAGQKTI